MVELLLSPQEQMELSQIAQCDPNRRVQARAQALLMVGLGLPVAAVASHLSFSRQTIYGWVARYQARSEEPVALRLLDLPRRTGCGKKWQAGAQLIQAAIQHPPHLYGYDALGWTTALLQRHLSARGLEASQRYIRSICRALGLSGRKMT